MSDGQGELGAAIADQNRTMESTGEVLTIEQHHEAARIHIIHALARLEQTCLTLEFWKSAGHIFRAIDSLKEKR